VTVSKLLFTLIPLGVVGVALARDLATINPPFPRLANCYGAGLGWQDWEQGKEYWPKLDLVIGGGYDLHYDWDNPRWAQVLPRVQANLARLREANPHVLVLPYVDVIEGPPDLKLPDQWWDRNEQGERFSGWPGMDRINTKLPEVLQYNLDKVRQEVLGRECFDGVFYDCWSPDKWLVPQTGKLRDGQAIVMVNAWNLPSQGFADLNGALAEDELNRVIEGKVDFEEFLGRYLRWCRESRKPAVTTLVCRPQVINDDPWRWAKMTHEERVAIKEKARSDEQPMRFGLATTLMGDGYFAYDSGTMGRGDWWWYKEYDAPLGHPRSDARRHDDGTWWREFDGGTVVVNGSGYDTAVVLPRKSRDVSTGRVGTRFTLPLGDGRIFVPSADPPTPGDDVAPQLTRQGATETQLVALPSGLLVARTPGGLEVRVEPNGAFNSILWKGKPLLRGGTPVVSAPPWKAFQLQDAALLEKVAGPQADGQAVVRLAFRGTWVCEQQQAAVIQRLTVGPDDRLTLSFDCEALTDLDLRMWRHYWSFPVAPYAGAQAEAEGKSLDLPAELKAVELLPAAKELTVTAADRRVTIISSLPLALVDHRNWGVEEYLLAGYPVSGKVPKGTKWQVATTVTVAAR
jgi:hypothetical protein